MPHDEEYAYPGKKSADLDAVKIIRDSTGLGMHEVKSLLSEHPGMTLRDHFAGQALTVLPMRTWEVNGKLPGNIMQIWAESSYALADAMLEARNGRK